MMGGASVIDFSTHISHLDNKMTREIVYFFYKPGCLDHMVIQALSIASIFSIGALIVHSPSRIS